MKQIVCILLLMLSLTATAQSESNNKVYFSPDANVTYRLFKTQNIHIFIKLDTRNGKMTLVQFSASNANDMMQVKLNDTELASGADAKNGRFYLYPTDNFYTFLLIDQIDGRVWQVQWSTDPDEHGLWRIP